MIEVEIHFRIEVRSRAQPDGLAWTENLAPKARAQRDRGDLLGGRSRESFECRELRGELGVSHQFPSGRSAMRRTILVLTIICCAPTAVMALTAGRAIIGDSELGASGPAIQQGQ